jgi:secreted trypsin-like serine protease
MLREEGLEHGEGHEHTEGHEQDGPVRIETRVIGGVASSTKSWPFVAALHRDGTFICGATIVSRSWVITAAHCVFEFDMKKYVFQVTA